MGSLAQLDAKDGAPPGALPGWRLRTHHTVTGLQQRETGHSPWPSGSGPLHLHAERVVLAAGTLGSQEILMRSRTD